MIWSKFKNDYRKWILLNGTKLQGHCTRQITWWIRLGSFEVKFTEIRRMPLKCYLNNYLKWTFLSGIWLGNLDVMTMTSNDLKKAESRLFRDSVIDTSLDEILWNFNSLSEINRIKSNRATNQKSAFMWSSWCIYFCFGSLLFRYYLLHKIVGPFLCLKIKIGLF